MIDFIFAIIAIAAAQDPSAATVPSSGNATGNVLIGEGVQIGNNTVIGNAVTPVPDGLAFDLSVVPAGLTPEPQTPAGKFTTAVEVKPILTATKANWVALRDYGGNDLVYVTHLWAWRCGLSAMALSINDGAMQNMELPDCHMEYATPNAVLENDGLPYMTYPQGSVSRITVQIVYDDLTTDIATFAADQIRIP